MLFRYFTKKADVRKSQRKKAKSRGQASLLYIGQEKMPVPFMGYPFYGLCQVSSVDPVYSAGELISEFNEFASAA